MGKGAGSVTWKPLGGHSKVPCKTKTKSKWQKNKKTTIQNIKTPDLGSNEEKTYVFTIQSGNCTKIDLL
jgi:hypothetical protein